jgi:heptosyltransferase-3
MQISGSLDASQSDRKVRSVSVAVTSPLQSVLIIQTKFLGDLVLSSALVRNIRLQFAGAQVVMLCAEGFEQFLKSHGIADATVTLRRARLRGSLLDRAREMRSLVRQLRRYRFDASIDLTDSKTSRVIAALVNAPMRVGYNPPEKPLKAWEWQPANLFATPFGGGEHFLDRYLSPLQALKAKVLGRPPRIDPLLDETAKADALFAKHGLRPQRFAVVHAGASFRGRCWPPERFAAAMDAIGKEFGLDFLLVGGPSEMELAETITSAAQARVVNCVGDLPLGTLLAVMHQARFFLGNESGPMHLAAAAGTPVVGLYGLTDPTRWGPIGVPHVAVRPSMPCDCIARDLCKWPDPSRVCCVWRLELDEVVDASRRLLRSLASSAEVEARHAHA